MSPYKLERLIEIIVEDVKGVDSSVENIILYGPYSRKDFSRWSDIDLLIILDCEKTRYVTIRDIILDKLIRLGFRYNETINPTITTKSALSETIDYIFYGSHSETGLIIFNKTAAETSSYPHTKLPIISKEHREYLKKYISSFDELLLGDFDDLLTTIDAAIATVGLDDDDDEPNKVGEKLEYIRDFIYHEN